ncbi:thioesterase family protein [Streptomyces sp. AC555_RSS877]|uniref:thioesterase family protein n=1 Tax=Streptomyces sp. AC555_RSS877 TaxID=2823688 RepID=UPI0020B6B131|nr:thioesterase family protein [Streptomyces sp. AC555_RSS877]
MESAKSADFLAATSVVRRTDTPGTFDSHLSPVWGTAEGIDGGILLAVAARATAAATAVRAERFFPSSVSAFFLTASRPGPVRIHTDVIQRGSRFTTTQVSLTQKTEDDREIERLRALVSHGTLASQAPVHTPLPPAITPPSACIARADAPGGTAKRLGHLAGIDIRLTPECAGWAFDSPSRTGHFDGWFRLANGRDPDPLALLAAVHALPPISFDFGRVGWLPTVQLTAHIRGFPAPGWLQVRTSTKALREDHVVEDAEVWDSDGELVLQSRQFAAFV